MRKDSDAARQLGADGKTEVRLIPILLFVALGGLCIFIGGSIAYQGTALRGDHASFWSGLLVNVGTSLLLAAALVWFERVVINEVQKSNQAAVDSAATSAARAVEDRVGGRLNERLDELDRRLEAATTDAANARMRAASDVGDLTFESMKRALSQARAINAIASRPGYASDVATIIVPAGDHRDAPQVQVIYYPPSNEYGEVIDFDVHTASGSARGTWTADRPVADAFAELSQELVTIGERSAAHALSAEAVFRNVGSVLFDAVAGRQGDDSSWTQGEPVFEMVAEGWIVSTAGIEVRDHGVVLEASQFGSYGRPGYGSQSNRVHGENIPTAPPSGLDVGIWERAIKQARPHILGVPLGFPVPEMPPPGRGSSTPPHR
ncbi:hypothetical protein ACPW96_08155 [Micromonospora sp. DT81.3]|uniref:hypothetical protein n=1 Tax=Micromonospora sp. DT81.3 TaxID=3416523 RepID=UPI003CECF4DD